MTETERYCQYILLFEVFTNTADLCGTDQKTIDINSTKCKGMPWKRKKNCRYQKQMTQEEPDIGILNEHGKSQKIKFISTRLKFLEQILLEHMKENMKWGEWEC